MSAENSCDCEGEKVSLKKRKETFLIYPKMENSEDESEQEQRVDEGAHDKTDDEIDKEVNKITFCCANHLTSTVLGRLNHF